MGLSTAYRVMLLGAGLMGAATFAGCAAAGFAGDFIGGTYDATQQLFQAGKADTYVNANWQDVVAAMRAASDKLMLHAVKEHAHPEQLKVVLQDDRKQDVTITIVRRTNTMTELHVDVGLLGPEGLGRLVLREIAHELRDAMTDHRLDPDEETPPATRK
ncbi:MAG: DUF3568 family protein [Phycisphaerae bacterium]